MFFGTLAPAGIMSLQRGLTAPQSIIAFIRHYKEGSYLASYYSLFYRLEMFTQHRPYISIAVFLREFLVHEPIA